MQADASTVQGRASAIERAVSNLVDNAGKVEPTWHPSSITRRRRRRARRDQVWDPAERAGAGVRALRPWATQSVPGSGLGLAIVRQVAEDHGGRA